MLHIVVAFVLKESKCSEVQIRGNRDNCRTIFFIFSIKNTVKPAYVVTSIKGSPVSGSLEPKYSANEPVLRGHLS